MIKILRLNGKSAPVLVCDVCGSRIEDAKNAAAVNNFNSETVSDGDLLDVIYTHKGKCHNRAESLMTARGVGVVGWLELQHHLVDLIHNVGLSPVELGDFDGMLERSGINEM